MANVKGTYGEFGLIYDYMGHTGGLLLVQRGPRPDGSPDGRWNLPGGGIDESDVVASRTPQEVVAREVEEETGLRVEVESRPVGTYATIGHTDRATTWVCRVVGGELRSTKEGVQAKYFNPREIMDLAYWGDKEDGLVGGLQTSTGGVPRHIQMCLHAFTREHNSHSYDADRYCKELGIPP